MSKTPQFHEFIDVRGDVLTVTKYGAAGIIIRFDRGPSGQSDLSGVIMDPATAPAIALAILEAAGFGQIHEHKPAHDDLPAMVELAAGHLANAVTIREQNMARKELTRRRDQLAKDLVLTMDGYDECTPGNRRAIDMIIQLQDEAQA